MRNRGILDGMKITYSQPTKPAIVAIHTVAQLDTMIDQLEDIEGLDPKLLKQLEAATVKIGKVADALRVRREGKLIIFPRPAL
jgi:hypothetical protein